MKICLVLGYNCIVILGRGDFYKSCKSETIFSDVNIYGAPKFVLD